MNQVSPLGAICGGDICPLMEISESSITRYLHLFQLNLSMNLPLIEVVEIVDVFIKYYRQLWLWYFQGNTYTSQLLINFSISGRKNKIMRP